MKENYLKLELYEKVKSDDRLFDFVQEAALDGIWYWNLEQTEDEWMSERFWTLFGIDPKTKKHKADEWMDLIFKDDLEVAVKNLNKHLEDPNHPYDQIVRYRHADGHTVWVRCRGLAIRDENGKPIRMIGAHNDITELKNLEKSLLEKNKEYEIANKKVNELNNILEKKANTDSLTGLYNRHFISDTLDLAVHKADRTQIPFTVLMIDINNFKYINDTYGHVIGDKVLIDFSNKVKSLLRKQDVVCRWGGDEFLIYFPDTSDDATSTLIHKIRAYFSKHNFNFEEINFEYSLAIGHATYKFNELLNDLIKRADAKMYKDKIVQKSAK